MLHMPGTINKMTLNSQVHNANEDVQNAADAGHDDGLG